MKHKILLDYFKALNKYHYIFGFIILITMIYANYLILILPIQFRFPKITRSELVTLNNAIETNFEKNTSRKNNNTLTSNPIIDPSFESNPLLTPVTNSNTAAATKNLVFLNDEKYSTPAKSNFLEINPRNSDSNGTDKNILSDSTEVKNIHETKTNINENNQDQNAINKNLINENYNEKYTIDDYCSYLENKNLNQTLNYQLAIDEENSIKNWSFNYQLYCENEYKKNYITSLIFTCSILSNLVMSVVADRYGRKFCFLFEAFGLFLAFVFLFFFGAHNFAILLIAIFGLQVFTHLFTVSYIYSYEFFINKYYNWIFLLQNILFSFFGILIFYLVEYIKSLYYIELTALIVSGLVYFLSFLYVLESPDWIISKLKHVEDKVNELLEENEDEHITQEKFKDNMRKINHFVDEFHFLKKEIKSVYHEFLEWEQPSNREEKKEKFDNTANMLEQFIPVEEIMEFEEFNKANLQPSEIKRLSSKKLIRLHHHHKKYESFWEFIKTTFQMKNVKPHFILAVYLWTVNQILYYSVITNLDRIENYVSYSFQVYFSTQIFSNLFLGYIFEYFKPKNIIYFSAVASLINMAFGVFYSQNFYVIIICFFVFTFLSGLINQSIYIFVPELFEAKIRSTCVSYSKFPAKIFLMITPFIWGTNMAHLILGLSISIFFTPLLIYFLHIEEKNIILLGVKEK